MRHLFQSECVRIWLMLAPALAVILLLFGGGVVVGFQQSIGYVPVLGLTTPTLRHYGEILSDQSFRSSLLLTLYISVTGTLLATMLAVMAALVLRHRFRGSGLATMVFQLPLPAPHLVAAAGIIMLLTQSGLFARMLYQLGGLAAPGDFPALVYDRWQVGTLLVYLWKEVPFIGIAVLAVLKSVGNDYEEAARTLGANAWQRFRYILLPLILPSVVSTSAIVFAYMFGSFEVPLLLGQRHPTTLPVAAYRAYIDPDLGRRPESMAMGMVITAVVVLLLEFYRRLARKMTG